MTIATLIEHDIHRVSVMEDTRQVMLWFKEFEYLVVVDENLFDIGIITMKDLVRQTGYQICDLNIEKPTVLISDTIVTVYHLMVDYQTIYLPVAKDERIIGVISIYRITEYLLAKDEKI